MYESTYEEVSDTSIIKSKNEEETYRDKENKYHNHQYDPKSSRKSLASSKSRSRVAHPDHAHNEKSSDKTSTSRVKVSKSNSVGKFITKRSE